MQKHRNQIQPHFIGIDWRPGAIYLLEFAGDRPDLRIKQAAIMTSSVQKIAKAVVSLSGADALLKELKIPSNLSGSELEFAVHSQAEKYFNKYRGEYSLDFYNFGVSNEESRWFKILLVACYKDRVNHFIEALDEATISPAVVDVEYLALHRATTLLADQLPLNPNFCTTAMLNLDEQSTVFQVSQGQDLIYARSEQQNNTHLKTHQSNDRNKLACLLAPGINVRINQCFEYYLASGHDLCDQLILCGDCAIIPELAYYVQKQQQLPVIVGNPLLNLDVSADVDAEFLKAAGPSFMRCSGLALWKHTHAVH